MNPKDYVLKFDCDYPRAKLLQATDESHNFDKIKRKEQSW